MDTGRGLVFVYNADSGFLNSIKDLYHKNLRPSTYSCRLCAITFNNSGMINKWKDFVNGLNIPVEFLHRDEFIKAFSTPEYDLPAAFVVERNKIRTFITSSEMNNMKDLEDLIKVVKLRI